ncbi:MAG: 4-hydroxybenzoate octaprenyltransferase, partial [Pseudomonadota bacterium]
MDRVQTKDMQGRVADAPSGHWAYRVLPPSAWPYAQIARWDRPIGWQLLLWPCLWGLGLAMASGNAMQLEPSIWLAVWHGVLFTIG